MYFMEERAIEMQRDVVDFWNSKKDDLWGQRILGTSVDLDKEIYL